ERRQQSLGFVVVLRGGRDADVQPTDRVDLVVLDFRENDLFLDADVVVAATVKRTTIDTAEVTHAGQRDSDEAVQEFVHANATQGHHATDGHVFADLETGDGLARHGHDGLLTGNLG